MFEQEHVTVTTSPFKFKISFTATSLCLIVPHNIKYRIYAASRILIFYFVAFFGTEIPLYFFFNLKKLARSESFCCS